MSHRTQRPRASGRDWNLAQLSHQDWYYDPAFLTQLPSACLSFVFSCFLCCLQLLSLHVWDHWGSLGPTLFSSQLQIPRGRESDCPCLSQVSGPEPEVQGGRAQTWNSLLQTVPGKSPWADNLTMMSMRGHLTILPLKEELWEEVAQPLQFQEAILHH